MVLSIVLSEKCVFAEDTNIRNCDKWNYSYFILFKGSSCNKNCISSMSFCIHLHIGYQLKAEHPAIRIQSCCFSLKFQYFLWRNQNPGNRTLGTRFRKKPIWHLTVLLLPLILEDDLSLGEEPSWTTSKWMG